MKRIGLYFLGALASLPLALAILMMPAPKSPVGTLPVFAQFGGTIPLDTQLCPTVGAIAVRNATRWQCVAPGANQQVFVSNGAGAVPGWTTPAGTGNVNAVGTPTAGQVPFWNSATTIKGISPGGYALDYINAANSTGYEKRTGTGAYTWAPIPVADLPAISGTDCSMVAGGPISCAALLGNAHTFTALQSFGGGGDFTGPIGGNPQGTVDGCHLSYNSGAAQGAYAANTGYLTCVYANNAWRNFVLQANSIQLIPQNGVLTVQGALQPSSALGVAYGGTGATSASGTSLDNITGFSTTGIMSRTGAGAYSFTSFSALHDSNFCTTQGALLYRNATAWVCLPPASSAGQVLASQGGGANPQWVAPGSVTPGTRVLLNTLTASSSATLTDTTSISGTYAEYEIDFENVFPSTSSVNFNMQVFISGTLATSGYKGGFNYIQGTSTNSIISASAVPLGTSLTSSTTYGGYNAKMFFSNPGAPNGGFVAFTGTGQYTNSSPVLISIFPASTAPTGAMTGFQFSMSSGNIASGTIKVYGWN